MHPHDNAEALLRVLTAPRRNRYFYGKRLDVQHLEMEQGYGKLKQWLLNRLTVGKGVLCGLEVTVDGARVCVEPGVAIDGLGREIVVPVRSCIDPLAPHEGCCGDAAAAPPAPPSDHDDRLRLCTLWLCYRECLADHEPVLASGCDTREHCAASTIVETFCLKVTPGLADPLGDPAWCARLWESPHGRPVPGTVDHLPGGPLGGVTPGASSGSATGPAGRPASADATPAASPLDALRAGAAAGGLSDAERAALRAAQESRRHLLCELFAGDCGPAEDDACVPLAAIGLLRGRIEVEPCLLRPRLYSNETLIELILCLADKIDECCGQHTPPVVPMKVRSIDFLRRTPGAAEALVASVASPLSVTAVDIRGNANAIRVRFDKPFAQDAHKPTTHEPGDVDFQRHNVQVRPESPLNNLPFVPGSLVIEAPDTVRFDLFADSPYSRGARGWQKGRYTVFLCGDEDLPANRQALTDLAGAPLDGEPIAPAAGVISGDGTKGGDFRADFVVGAGEQPPELMHVSSVEFIERAAAGEHVLATMQTPLEETAVVGRVAAIRVRLSKPFAQDSQNVPTTHGVDDPDFQRHSLQVRLAARDARVVGVPYVPGTLAIEAADTLRFDVALGTRVVDGNGNWPRAGVRCELVLRGSPGTAGQRPPLADTGGSALDGEPAAPANGVISGDGAAGGDFLAPFSVRIAS